MDCEPEGPSTRSLVNRRGGFGHGWSSVAPDSRDVGETLVMTDVGRCCTEELNGGVGGIVRVGANGFVLFRSASGQDGRDGEKAGDARHGAGYRSEYRVGANDGGTQIVHGFFP